MKILIDYREGRSRIPYLLEKFKVPVEITNLEIGDYLIGDICVERKDIHDYVGSLVDGRLEKQLYQMSASYPFSYLIVEGYISEALMYSKMKRAPFYSSLIGCSFKRALEGEQGQIVTLNVETPFDSALCLRFLYEKVMTNEPRIMRMPKLKAKPEQILVHVLSSIPGIGEKRGEKLLSEFGSLREVFKSTDWNKVEGIGDKLNFQIQSLLDRRWKT